MNRNIYLFGSHRCKHTNSISYQQAIQELPWGWGYIIHNGMIYGMKKEDAADES